MITKVSMRVRGSGRPPGASLLARGEEHQATAPSGGWAPSAVTCGSCRYSNQLSQAFFTLSVSHLYCRRCGRMIDREGREAVPA